MCRNRLYYGDNLDILRERIKEESVDMCYIDPPFNSKRNFSILYGNDKAQTQAFADTFKWGAEARREFKKFDLKEGEDKLYPENLKHLMNGLKKIVNKNDLAYYVSITMRIVEIYRVLKPDGSLFVHCDSTSSHTLKLILDCVFNPRGGDSE